MRDFFSRFKDACKTVFSWIANVVVGRGANRADVPVIDVAREEQPRAPQIMPLVAVDRSVRSRRVFNVDVEIELIRQVNPALVEVGLGTRRALWALGDNVKYARRILEIMCSVVVHRGELITAENLKILFKQSGNNLKYLSLALTILAKKRPEEFITLANFRALIDPRVDIQSVAVRLLYLYKSSIPHGQSVTPENVRTLLTVESAGRRALGAATPVRGGFLRRQEMQQTIAGSVPADCNLERLTIAGVVPAGCNLETHTVAAVRP